jgi:glycosyltransferase involved in cell wall biosynthesis
MKSRYILITAAKNEETYIEVALKSVLSQTVRPIAWFIMDDGSTDRTAEIIRTYAADNPFIRLVSVESGTERCFGSKDRAINAAYAQAQSLEFDLVGFQDADIAPERMDYYETVLNAFEKDAKLGIAGGFIYERSGGVWECRPSNAEDSVAGGIQMFRRACFDQIGGYVPLSYGGEDWLAQIDARMAGWRVMTLPEFRILHYRPTSSAGGILRGWFRLGLLDASFGSHPLVEFLKCLRRTVSRPLIVGGVLRFCGYLWWVCRRRPPLIPEDKVAFLRSQQLLKIRGFSFQLRRKSLRSAERSCCQM